MKLIDRLSYYTWNIGFVEKSISDILAGPDNRLIIHWLKHDFKDHFFADPFLLPKCNDYIEVLVEDFPYYNKKGIIALLVIDQNYNLIEKRTICEQPYHQSYPFVFHHEGKTYVVPEASKSGSLWIYELNTRHDALINRKLLINEPLLDPTLCKIGEYWWLFCTKRGKKANQNLYVYYSNSPLGPYNLICNSPLKSDLSSSRPAGCMVEVNGKYYRTAQVCSHSYGEGIAVCIIDDISTTSFSEHQQKTIAPDMFFYPHGLHTLNYTDGLCVVDGLAKEFVPLRKIKNELINLFTHNSIPNLKLNNMSKL